jgi:hypothetical protein
MSFFPVSAVSVTAAVTTATTILPTVGTIIRLTREINASRVFIKFGTASVTATTSDSMELTAGLIEELENPNPTAYTYFAVICDTGTCGVNVSVSPKF